MRAEMTTVCMQCILHITDQVLDLALLERTA